jgi:hypothetical protein
MNPRTIKSLSFALLGLLLFFAVVILFRIYSDKEVPAQFTGALLGAIVTAAITMALLHGQSQAEETKERNVKVFEEKTRRYNDFLSKLWKVWEDRHVTLEELNDLVDTFSRDLIIYTKKDSTKQLLEQLTEIAKYSGDNALTEEGLEAVRRSLYQIVNILADELNLGGELCDNTQKKLKELDGKIRPLLIAKQAKQDLLEEVSKALRDPELEFTFGPPKYEKWRDDEYLWIQMDQGQVYLALGPVSIYKPPANPFIGLYVEFFGNRECQEHREALRGWAKDFLSPMKFDAPILDFNKPEALEKKRIEIESASGKKWTVYIAEMMIQYVKNWQSKDGKNLRVLIDECGYNGTVTQSNPTSPQNQ